MVPHTAREPRGLSLAQASFNYLSYEIKRDDRIMGRVFRDEIVAWKFVKNSHSELVRRWSSVQFVQLNSCP